MLSIQIHLHFQMYNSFSSRISQRSEPKVHNKQHQTNDHLNAIHLQLFAKRLAVPDLGDFENKQNKINPIVGFSLS